MKVAAVGLAFLVFLAGCAGAEEGSAGGTGGAPTGSDAVVNPFAKPLDWGKGRWWTYAVTSTGGGGMTDPQMTLIATEVQTDHYVVDTTSRSQAAFDAEMDVSYVGPIERKSLSGQQQNQKVQYFQFPLEAKREWTTTWDGVTRSIEAMGAQGDEFLLEASESGKVRVRYSYHAIAGFFGFMEFLDAQGSAMFRFQLSDYGENYTGPYVRATIKQLITPVNQADQPSHQANVQFRVDQGTSEMVLRYDIRCNPQVGSWDLAVKPTDPSAAQTEGHQESSPPSACTKALNKTMSPVRAGDWVFDSKAALVTGPNHFRVSVVGRTYQELVY